MLQQPTEARTSAISAELAAVRAEAASLRALVAHQQEELQRLGAR